MKIKIFFLRSIPFFVPDVVFTFDIIFKIPNFVSLSIFFIQSKVGLNGRREFTFERKLKFFTGKS